MKEKIDLLNKFIQESRYTVFFGGAGVSTESGIPDFRSKDGLYNQKDEIFEGYEPEYLVSADCLMGEPEVFYKYYKLKRDVRDIKPNITHYTLAKMEECGKLKSIITQNIDGLHQSAGSKNVIEIHGSSKRNYCSKCGKPYDEKFIFDSKESLPKCETCAGLVRPDVILYGENLHEDKLLSAIREVRKADLLIVAGTSLTVFPASQLTYYFKGRYLVIINKEPVNVVTNTDTLVFQESIGEIFSQIDLW